MTNIIRWRWHLLSQHDKVRHRSRHPPSFLVVRYPNLLAYRKGYSRRPTKDIFNQIRAGKVIDRTWYFYFSRIVHYRGDFWRATNETVTYIGTQFCGTAIKVSVQVKCISYLSVDGVFIYLVCQLILITFRMESKEELKYSKQITTLRFVLGCFVW